MKKIILAAVLAAMLVGCDGTEAKQTELSPEVVEEIEVETIEVETIEIETYDNSTTTWDTIEEFSGSWGGF